MVNHKNSFLKNYRPSILLISGLLAGGVLGAVLGENARVLQPIGTLFLNLVFVLVVPLVFFSVARSMISMHRSGVIGKMLGTVICVFLLMSLVAGIFSYGFMSLWNPFAGITRYPGEAVQSGGGFSGDLNLGDLATAVNGSVVHIDHILNFLAVALHDELLHLLDSQVVRNDARNLEEGALEDGVGAVAQTNLGGNLRGVDDIHINIIEGQILLHIVGKMFLGLSHTPRRVVEERAVLLQTTEAVVLAEVTRDVDSHEVRRTDEVRSQDGLVTETQV